MRTHNTGIKYYFESARFVVKKHLKGYRVRSLPSFDSEGVKFFETVIKKTSKYLEYGSGGSTLIAAQFVDVLVCVESDRVFMASVRAELSKSSRRCAQYFFTPNIGFTREWGYPVFRRPTSSRVSRWRQYPGAPWPLFKEKNMVPDTILIDGRFRVACALESLLNIGPSTRIIVDDYVGRSYAAIENYADLIALHGRMAEFRKKTEFNALACEVALMTSYVDVN
jgi:hypothetical protein